MEPSERLNGWKEIADYLGRSVRSVQRNAGWSTYTVGGAAVGGTAETVARLER